ncbi:MAG TPA: twin-arginine translocase TatA/TatE family subunit [Pirellulales bacterium]|nr:twin-arginine translocase TatA/TatE family subunit [Pirellulales bacterium]
MTPLFGIFGVGPVELIAVGGVILVLFGHRLPSLMRSVGRSVVEFKQGIKEDPEGSSDRGGSNASIDDHAKTPTGKS